MDTRARILQAARRAFSEKGYAATRLDDLAAELGLTKGALYHHFRSKRELLLALLEASQAEARRALEGEAPLEERLLRYALAYQEGVEPLAALASAQRGPGWGGGGQGPGPGGHAPGTGLFGGLFFPSGPE
jgi:AcrR family transcriptional regulator